MVVSWDPSGSVVLARETGQRRRVEALELVDGVPQLAESSAPFAAPRMVMVPMEHTQAHPFLRLDGADFGWFGPAVLENGVLLQTVWWLAAGYHVAAAFYSVVVTVQNGYSASAVLGWFLQTLWCGTASIHRLHSKTRLVLDAVLSNDLLDQTRHNG